MSGAAARRRAGAAMADAAADVVASLDDDQRARACWPAPTWPSPDDPVGRGADEERHRWYYTPTDHGGVALAELRPAQQRLVMRLVATGLSRAGFVTVSTVIGLENVLDELEGWTASWDRERGRDPGYYQLRIFGDPAGPGPWSWRFGGHHVSLHHLVVEGELVASTPCFLGADPASSPLLGPHPLRPLAGVEDLARELVRSLDEAQAARCIVSPVAPVDLVTGNRPRIRHGDLPPHLADVWRGRFGGPMAELVERIQRSAEETAGLRPEHLDAVRLRVPPSGLPAGRLRPDQRDALRELLGLYVGRLPDDVADVEAAKFSGPGLDALHLLWAGGTEAGQPHYYRVHGPRLLVEYDNTQRGANHVHSVWRDPEGDFGDDVLARHYAEAHGGRPTG